MSEFYLISYSVTNSDAQGVALVPAEHTRVSAGSSYSIVEYYKCEQSYAKYVVSRGDTLELLPAAEANDKFHKLLDKLFEAGKLPEVPT